VAAELTTHDGSLSSADGIKLFWRSWEVTAPTATFAVVHGLGEHSGRYARFAEAMAGRGYSTFAIDLRGHGQSGGPRGHVDSWNDWVKDVEQFVEMVGEHSSGGEVIPLGHSFGGVVLLSAVLQGAVTSRRFALSNPALAVKVKVPGWKLSVGRFTSQLLPRLTLSNEVDPAAISRDPAAVQAYRDDPLVHSKISTRLFSEWTAARSQVLSRAAEIKTPFLVIVGDADPLIDPEGSLELDRRASGAPHLLRRYAGRYHEPFNDLDANEVFDDLASWAAKSAAPASP
jgi:alpha-beta hydrolase superfamily lysophospholipase